MPNIVTHSYFMKDVYDKISLEKKIFLQNETKKLCFFSQGIDLLKYYYSFNKKKSKKIKNFSKYFHENKTDEFLITMINYIKYNYYKDNAEIMAMLYSLISHYVLDYKLNPYIYYKSGIFNPKNKNTYKYNSKILETEAAIDKYLIKLKEKKLPHKYKHYKNLFTTTTLSKDTIEVINFCFKEIFNINDFHKTWIVSSKKAKRKYKKLRYDPFGIKSMLYKIHDTITPKRKYKLAYLSYKTMNKNIECLNLNHIEWNYPTSKRKKSKKSFIELYTEAINTSIKLIEKIDEYIYEDKKINLKKLLKNYSYTTGTETSKSQEMKYFEF